MNYSYIWSSFLILFFFFRGGQFLLNNLSPNWAYIIDQLGLAIIGGILGLMWLKKKNYFNFGWITALLIVILVLMSHYHSFYRTFMFDELRNIIAPLGILHGYHGDPSSVAPGFAGPSGIRERYGWSITTLVYELVGINHSYSIFAYPISSILLLVIASLGAAWIAGLLSNSKIAAFITGLLVGIAPNSFMALIWPTNMQTDGLGAILVTFTIGIWLIARKTEDKKGVLIALILLAATLKGGSVVRTAMTGGLLILTDIIFFPNLIKKGAWRDWLKIIIVSIAFYMPNAAAHWQLPTTPSAKTMDFATRLSFLADATTRSFIPPLMLIPLLNHLKAISYNITWTVAIGITFFTIGTVTALFTFLKSKYRYVAWGWVWFYACIWFFPWLAELHSKPNDDAGDLTFAGYKYGYLSMFGIYIVLGIFLSSQIRKFYFVKEQKKKVVGVLFAILAAGILLYRLDEFVKLDLFWRKEFSTHVRAWYTLVFTTIPPPTGPSNKASEKPSALVEIDKTYPNQMTREASLFVPVMYYDGSLLFYDDVNTFHKEVIIEKKIPPERVHAITWDVNKKEVINISSALRRWLIEGRNSKEDIPNFRY